MLATFIRGDKPMIRKLILPVAALVLLAGCATGYSYRTAPGDYYYGQPGTVYRDYYGPSYYSPYGCAPSPGSSSRSRARARSPAGPGCRK